MLPAPHDIFSPETRIEAARWDARLRSTDCTSDDRAAFNAWLEADPHNVAAYETLQLSLASLHQAYATAPMLQRLRHDALQANPARVTPLFQRAAAALAAVALLTGGMLLWTDRHDGQTASAPLPRFETTVGERATFALPDGSQLTLDSKSAVEIEYTGSIRGLKLERGQAHFDVAHDSARPFVVTVDQRSVTAVGTAFDIRKGARNTTVTVVEGEVRVTSTTGSKAASDRHVIAGQRLTADLGSGRDNVATVDLLTETSWRKGQIIFDDTPLANVLEDLNRYTDKPIVLQDQELAQLRVSGMFTTAKPMRFVNGLSDYLPVKLQVISDEVVLSRQPE